MSLLRFLASELRVRPPGPDVPITDDKAWRSIANFLRVPVRLERILFFGYFLCMDCFLFYFTVLPIRTVVATTALLRSLLLRRFEQLNRAYLCDLVQFLLVVLTVSFLLTIDHARIFHYVRGQNVLKLYVIFNGLEILDKLLSSFGQDILDALLFSIVSRHGTVVFARHFVIALVYTCAHAATHFGVLVTLNVAIHSSNNALLTLLVSNQFVELKGSVFKKIDKEMLFQMTCSDVAERFQLSLVLLLITLQNPILVFPGPLLMILLSEVAVDWVKHAFVAKFNLIYADMYARYRNILCRDMLAPSQANTMLDRTHDVLRRVGLVPMPLCCLVVWNAALLLPESRIAAGALVTVIALCLMALKVLLSIMLLGYATSKSAPASAADREKAPRANAPRHCAVTGPEDALALVERYVIGRPDELRRRDSAMSIVSDMPPLPAAALHARLRPAGGPAVAPPPSAPPPPGPRPPLWALLSAPPLSDAAAAAVALAAHADAGTAAAAEPAAPAMALSPLRPLHDETGPVADPAAAAAAADAAATSTLCPPLADDAAVTAAAALDSAAPATPDSSALALGAGTVPAPPP